MESDAPESTEVVVTATPEATAAQGRDWYVWKLAAQTLAGIVGFVGITVFLGQHFKPEITAFVDAFYQRFGLPGVFGGVYLADAITTPIPPQLFLAAAMRGTSSHLFAFSVICLASWCGGSTGYRFAAALSSARLLRGLVARTRPKVEKLFERYGFWGVAFGSILPIPYSILCYMAGLYRMPRRLFAVLLMFRVVRLGFFYLVMQFGLFS